MVSVNCQFNKIQSCLGNGLLEDRFDYVSWYGKTLLWEGQYLGQGSCTALSVKKDLRISMQSLLTVSGYSEMLLQT